MNNEEWETIRVVDKPLGELDEKSVGRYGVVPAGRLVMQLDNITEKLYWAQKVRDSGYVVLIESEKGKTANENILLRAFETRFGFPEREIKEKMIVYIWRYCLQLQDVALENMVGEVPVLNQSYIGEAEFREGLKQCFEENLSEHLSIRSYCHDKETEFTLRLHKEYGRLARLAKMNGLPYCEEHYQWVFETEGLAKG